MEGPWPMDAPNGDTPKNIHLGGEREAWGPVYGDDYQLETDSFGECLEPEGSHYGVNTDRSLVNMEFEEQSEIMPDEREAWGPVYGDDYQWETDSFGECLEPEGSHCGVNTDRSLAYFEIGKQSEIMLGEREAWGPVYGDVYQLETDSFGECLEPEGSHCGVNTDRSFVNLEFEQQSEIMPGEREAWGPVYGDDYQWETDSFGECLEPEGSHCGVNTDRSLAYFEIGKQSEIMLGEREAWGPVYGDDYQLETDSFGECLEHEGSHCGVNTDRSLVNLEFEQQSEIMPGERKVSGSVHGDNYRWETDSYGEYLEPEGSHYGGITDISLANLEFEEQSEIMPTTTDSGPQHFYSHSSMMDHCLRRGQLKDALASARPRDDCEDICFELLDMLQLQMLIRVLISISLGTPKHLPKFLATPNVKDVLSHLMALGSLLTNFTKTKLIFEDIVWAYYPDNVQIFFDTFTQNIHDDTHRKKFWKNVRSAMERHLYTLLRRINEASGSKQALRELQKNFSDLIQAMAIPLHDDTVPAIPYDSFAEYSSEVEHCPLFTRAVKLKLVPEALLLYETGAVGNKELRLLAEDSDVQKIIENQEDNFMFSVFLRKVLHKPRSLECLATMQVSRLLWCHAPGDKEQKARDLGLLDFQVERVLLRRQCDRYRAALKQADDEDVKAGAS